MWTTPFGPLILGESPEAAIGDRVEVKNWRQYGLPVPWAWINGYDHNDKVVIRVPDTADPFTRDSARKVTRLPTRHLGITLPDRPDKDEWNQWTNRHRI